MDGEGPSSEGGAFLSRMALNDNKAGMEGLDREKINKIIMETSKGSRFYENEQKKEQQVNRRIEKMLQQKAQISEAELKKARAQVQRMEMELERGRDLSRAIVHVDMDAFYAAVEIRDRPELKDQAMAVGSMSMLSTSNYKARKFGVRAGMPGFIAKKLCPDLVIVPPSFDKYRAVSDEVREIFADYDPHFQPLSLDEAYLDFTEHLRQRSSWPESARTHCFRHSEDGATGRQLGDAPVEEETAEAQLSPVLFEDSPSRSPSPPRPAVAAAGRFEVFGTSLEEAVREMRFRIEQKTMLTASAGIAPNMMLAKVCSDKNKPNGQYLLPATREAVSSFVQELPVRKVCGIGKVSEKLLNALGVSSCSDLGQQMAVLSLLFSETSWHHFLGVALGLGATRIQRSEERKSMSTERTFRELDQAEQQLRLCRELCEDLGQDMAKEGLRAKTVTLKLKNVNFEVRSRALTPPSAVATAEEIFAVAEELLRTEIESESPQPLRLRLMGVRLSAFVAPDGKKPLQRSILGFLHTGPTPHQESQPLSLPDCPPTLETEPQPQRSFFQRALRQRLDQEGRGSSVPEETWSGPSKPVPVRGLAETHSTGFTCPVCFRLVDTTDLHVFNTHVDICLSNTAMKPSGCTDGKSESGSDRRSVLHRQDRQIEKGAEPEMKERGGETSSASVVPSSSVPQQEHGESHSGWTGPELVCPVCQVAQHIADLAAFNRHVDVCLNREVLHQLEGRTPAVTALGLQGADALQPRPLQARTSKSKRRDSPSSPPAKKAKGQHPRNTIDKFFR